MKRILLTGASGNMGIEAVKLFAESKEDIEVVLFSLDSDRDREILQPYAEKPHISVFWGDIRNKKDVENAISDVDIVLHIAAVIPPLADHQPELAWNVNYGGTKNVVDAIKESPRSDQMKLVSIGSVAMTGNRVPPYHMGRIGDPLAVSAFDYYGISKIAAERYLIDSDLKNWVSLRQTGIMHENLFKVNDGIGYHVPLDNRMEWVTAKDSGRLLYNICMNEISEEFWNNVYNISGGEECRYLGIEFLTMMYSLLNVSFKDIEKPNFYALRNFHGQFYYDSDKLEDFIHFRQETLEDVLVRMNDKMPIRYKMLKYLPKFIVRFIMKRIAMTGNTPLNWIKNNDTDKINAFLISKEKWRNIPDWDQLKFEKNPPSKKLNHGYDETKEDKDLNIEDMKGVAEYRGGHCLSTSMIKGNMNQRLDWECADGHQFKGSPFLILKAGHWCDKCAETPWNFDHQAKSNKFLAQVWYSDHHEDENNVYGKKVGEY